MEYVTKGYQPEDAPVSYTHLDVYKRQGIEELRGLFYRQGADQAAPGMAQEEDLLLVEAAAQVLAQFADIGNKLADVHGLLIQIRVIGEAGACLLYTSPGPTSLPNSRTASLYKRRPQ